MTPLLIMQYTVAFVLVCGAAVVAVGAVYVILRLISDLKQDRWWRD